MKICPVCQRGNADAARHCGDCGASIREIEITDPSGVVDAVFRRQARIDRWSERFSRWTEPMMRALCVLIGVSSLTLSLLSIGLIHPVVIALRGVFFPAAGILMILFHKSKFFTWSFREKKQVTDGHRGVRVLGIISVINGPVLLLIQLLEYGRIFGYW